MASFLKRIYGALRYQGDKSAKYARKYAQREAKFNTSLWQKGEALSSRQYADYDAYVKHQAEKLDRYLERRRGKEDDEYAEFLRRFELAEELDGRHVVVCLGARLGTEVRALIERGHFAVGVDLNPGPGNEYVCVGDLHRLVFADDSVDAVYTNVLDHVFDLERAVGEVDRILRPDGVFIADVVPGFEEGFFVGEYESMHWSSVDELRASIERAGDLVLLQQRDLGVPKRDRWIQLVFGRAASSSAPPSTAS